MTKATRRRQSKCRAIRFRDKSVKRSHARRQQAYKEASSFLELFIRPKKQKGLTNG